MASSTAPVISGAVEGLIDDAAVRRLIRAAGGEPGAIHGRNGKDHLRNQLAAYNYAAEISPWVVLMDLDHDAECVPPFLTACLAAPAAQMSFRVAVRAIEAWLIADRGNLARFLGISLANVPRNPEDLDNPKVTMVNLARKSRRRDIREDMVPRPTSGRAVGPAYASRLIEFIEDKWEPEAAAEKADSLRRCCARLQELVQRST